MGAGLAVAGTSTAASAAETGRKRSLRFLHLPDTHIQPELGAPEGVAACLKHVNSLSDKPAFMLVAGDIIMDSMGADLDRTKVQWDVWKKVLSENWERPVKYCLGDHDCWGIRKEMSGATGSEPYYGKQMAFDVLNIDKAYYSFDESGWHFVVLDSLDLPADAVYEGKIDEDQWAWFEKDLAATDPKTPIVIHTHIPILSGAVALPREFSQRPGGFAGGPGGPQGRQRRGFTLPEGVRGTFIQPSRMHLDAARFKNLFVKYPNVKLCLSGHLHVRERLDYNGVAYVSNGAVCGDNWRGDKDQTKPGYGIVDLYDDGTFDEQYITFGWKWPDAEA